MTHLSDAALHHLRAVADQPDLTGTRYELIEPLGRGGMGTVYRVADRELQREVALKVLAAAADTAEGLERLAQEARVLARLEHPGIVPVHDVGRLRDGRAFYTMKLVRGNRLDHLVVANTPLAECLQIFERICEAVRFAHAQGVVHRDLKPGNIMVGAFGEVLVMDWGVAKVRDVVDLPPVSRSTVLPDGPDTIPGTVLGTPGYMAPEQRSGQPGAIDERSDVHALGAILRFLVTGAPAETDGSARAGNPAVPRAIEAICRKATAHVPAERYQTVGHLAADVARFRNALPVSAFPERLPDRARRLASKYRVPLALVLAYVGMRVLLLLLARR